MRDTPDLAERAASLLEAEPSLVRVLGLRDATAIGHRRVLPVLAVPVGPWSPPARDALGAGTVALAVLDGLLTDGDVLLGPRDVFDAWGEAWTACAPMRLAVIGDAFADALRTWPAATSRAPGAVAVRVPAGAGAVDDRVLELLWRIAMRWGRPSVEGVALPGAVDAGAVGLVLGVGELEAGLALATLGTRGVALRGGALHLSCAAADAPRRDTLRAAATQQLAVARAANEDCLALCEVLHVVLRSRSNRFPVQKTSARPARVRPSQVRASTQGAAGGRIPTQDGRSAPRLRGRRQALGPRFTGVRPLPDKFLPPSFRCDVETDGSGAARIRPVGELDMSTVPVLEASMQDARAAGSDLLVIDLRELEFMDSTGLTLLTRWSLGAERDGYDLALVAGNDRIQRLFELTRLITHFKFVDG